AVVIHSPVDPDMVSRNRARRDRWLVAEEADALLAVAPPQLLIAPAAGLLGGLRIGEILTLRPRVDIDLEVGTISIVPKQIGIRADGTPRWWHPKTRRSQRVIPISTELRPFIEAHLAQFASDHWLMPALEDPSLPFHYKTFNKHFNAIVGDAGLIVGRKDPRGVVFHTLR